MDYLYNGNRLLHLKIVPVLSKIILKLRDQIYMLLYSTWTLSTMSLQCFKCISGFFLCQGKTAITFDISTLLGLEYIVDVGFIT